MKPAHIESETDERIVVDSHQAHGGIEIRISPFLAIPDQADDGIIMIRLRRCDQFEAVRFQRTSVNQQRSHAPVIVRSATAEIAMSGVSAIASNRSTTLPPRSIVRLDITKDAPAVQILVADHLFALGLVLQIAAVGHGDGQGQRATTL
jgi:hypothetical protein